MVSNVMDTDTSVGALLFWAMTALTCIERVLLEEGFSPWPLARRVSDRPSTLIKQGDAVLTLLALRNVPAAEWCAGIFSSLPAIRWIGLQSSIAWFPI